MSFRSTRSLLFLIITTGILTGIISCSHDPEDEIKPNTSLIIPPLTDSLFTINYDSTFKYTAIQYYPGYGNWDTTIYFQFDIDGDAVPDFNFRSFCGVTWLGSSTPYYTNENFSIEGDSSNQFTDGPNSGIDVYPAAGTQMDSSLLFVNSGYLEVYVPSISYNYWPLLNQSQYIGIKLNRNGNSHYGWMEVQKLPAGYMKLVRIVYDLIPDSPVIISS